MRLGLAKAARLSTIVLAGLAVAAAAIWAYGRIEQWRSDRAASRRIGIGTSWPYHSGAHLLAAFSVNTRQDLVNIGKSNSKWPRWLRWLRTESGWARAGARYAEEMNEQLASISILDPAKARAFALEFAMLIRVQRAQTPEERLWRKGVLAGLTAFAATPPAIAATATPVPAEPPARPVSEEDLEWKWSESSGGVKVVGPRRAVSEVVETLTVCNGTRWKIYSLRITFDVLEEGQALDAGDIEPGKCVGYNSDKERWRVKPRPVFVGSFKPVLAH